MASNFTLGRNLNHKTQPKGQMVLFQQEVSAKKPTTKSSHFPLSPVGLTVSNMIHVNSMSYKKNIKNHKSRSENIKVKKPQTTSLPLCTSTPLDKDVKVRKEGTRVNTIVSSHNWGTK